MLHFVYMKFKVSTKMCVRHNVREAEVTITQHLASKNLSIMQEICN